MEQQPPQDVIVIEPPSDSEAMSYFLQRMNKSPEDLATVLREIDSFVTANREAITCVLVEGMENTLRVMVGTNEDDDEMTDRVTGLDSTIAQRDWMVDVMNFATEDIEQLRSLSDQLPTADDESNALSDDERSVYEVENEPHAIQANREIDELYELQDKLDR